MTVQEQLEALQQAIEDLQGRVAFQDDVIEQLNAVIAKQDRLLAKVQNQLQQVTQTNRDLREEVKNLGDGNFQEKPPPHY